MDSTDLQAFEQRARRKYEWARVRRALLGFSPAVVVITAAALTGKHPMSTAALGVALFAFGVLLLWYGRDVRRAVLPGLALGALPLVLALCANHVHSCHDGVCVTWCVPACALGGLGAGIGVGIIGQRARHSLGYWLGASALTLLTGAMGCNCAGYGGVVGLAAGFVIGVGPAFLRTFLQRRAR
ncbi:MAG TPA: hypothetical protein VFQ61_21740 [Polyangiaceae bacterium]|nr:hypothetical protein [Polyangiaceae bacterium]